MVISSGTSPLLRPRKRRRCRFENLGRQFRIVDRPRQHERSDKTGHRRHGLFSSSRGRSARQQFLERFHANAKAFGEGAAHGSGLTGDVRSQGGEQTAMASIVAMALGEVTPDHVSERRAYVSSQSLPPFFREHASGRFGGEVVFG